VLSIGATPPFCDGFVAKAVATFVAERHGVKVSLHSMATPVVLDRVLNREVDMGIGYEPFAKASVRMEEILRADIGCILPARHPLAKRKSIRLRDLEPYPIVTYLPQALLRPHIDRAFSDKSAAPRMSVGTSTSATAIMLALHGAGLAIVETSLFEARPVAGLVVRPLEPRIELKGLLLRPRQGVGSRVLDDFVAHLRATFP
jgi:DNA-binding transcriptional LysR family regulator